MCCWNSFPIMWSTLRADLCTQRDHSRIPPSQPGWRAEESETRVCPCVSAVAGQDVEEVIDLVFVKHGHLGGALGALDRVVDFISVHPCWRWASRLVWLPFCSPTLLSLPAPLLLFLLGFVPQHLVSLHCAVHNEHGSILRPVLLMPEWHNKDWSFSGAKSAEKQGSYYADVEGEIFPDNFSTRKTKWCTWVWLCQILWYCIYFQKHCPDFELIVFIQRLEAVFCFVLFNPLTIRWHYCNYLTLSFSPNNDVSWDKKKSPPHKCKH